MKAYGTPRTIALEGGVDCADGRLYAVKTSRISSRGRSYIGHDLKARLRRYWKKRERRAARREIENHKGEVQNG